MRLFLALLLAMPCWAGYPDPGLREESHGAVRYTPPQVGDVEYLCLPLSPVLTFTLPDSSVFPLDSAYMRVNGVERICDSLYDSTGFRYDTSFCEAYIDGNSLYVLVTDTLYPHSTVTVIAVIGTADSQYVDTMIYKTCATLWSYPADSATGISTAATVRWAMNDTTTNFTISKIWLTLDGVPVICDSIYYTLGYRFDVAKWIVTITSDTLNVRPQGGWSAYQEVYGFIAAGTDTAYRDTISFWTAADYMLAVNYAPFRVTGESWTGSTTVSGFRSVGMDVYCSKWPGSPVIRAADTEEPYQTITNWYPAWSFTWGVLQPYRTDSCRVWGISRDGLSSDTTTVWRRYYPVSTGKWK